MIIVWILIFTLLLFALLCVLYPFLKKQHLSITSIVIIFISATTLSFFSILFYQKIGASRSLAVYYKNQKVIKSKQVINQLKLYLLKDPGHPKGWHLLGNLYLKEGDYQNALLAFDKANLHQRHV